MLNAILLICKSAPNKVFLLSLFLALQAIMPSINLYATGQLVHAIQDHGLQHIYTLIALWCLSLMGGMCLQPLVNLFQGDVTELSTKYFNLNIIQKINEAQTLDIFEDKSSYERIELLRKESSHRPLNFIVTMAHLVRAIITVSMVMGILLYSSGLGLLICGFSTLPLLAINIINEQRNWKSILINSKEAVVMKYIYDAATHKSNAREIKVFGAGDLFANGYSDAAIRMHENLHSERRRSIYRTIPMVLLSLCLLFVGVLVFFKDFHYANSGTAALVIAFQALLILRSALGEMAYLVPQALTISKFFKIYAEFINFNKKAIPLKPAAPGSFDGPLAIAMENISFDYQNGDRLFDNFSINIKSGEKIAILGDNGSGKSTLINLMLGLYKIEKGDIRVNDISINDMDLESFRDKVSVVFQDFGKYEFSVPEDVVFSELNVNIDAAEITHLLHSVNLDIPADLKLGKRFGGDDLSIGQWQKLAVARALYRKANLFIFDEFSSALDPESEDLLFDVVLDTPATVISITHRLGKIKKFDRIIVLDHGKIIEDGDFDSLIKREGKFYRMWGKQFQYVLSSDAYRI